MAQENDYRALIRSDQEQQAGELRTAVAGPVKPDARAEALRLAGKYRLPHDIVERNLEAFKQRELEDVPEERRLLQLNPKLADWLRESPAAAAVADDLPKMQELDNRLTFGASILRGVDNVQSMVGGHLEFLGELTGSQRLTRYGREVRVHNEQQAADLGYRSGLDDALRGPWELGQYLKELAGEQIPVMAPLMVGGVAGAKAGAVVGSFAGPAGTAVGTTLGAIIGAAIPSFVLGTGEVQSQVKNQDPNASAPELVLLGGTAVAALDTVLPGKIGGRLVKTFGRETAEAIAKRALAAPVAPRFLRGVSGQGVTGLATEAVTEALQEAIAGVTASAGTGNEVDWRQLGRQMVEAGVAGGLVGGGMSAGARALEQPRLRARFAAAQQSQTYFEALGGTLKDAKLLERLPAGAREFVARVTKDGPLETVYAPTKQFEEYWQSQGVDPGVMAAELTGKADALQHARETGIDLAIPLANYATQLAATDHNTFFAGELRLAPHLMNAREAGELQAEFERLQAEGPPAETTEATEPNIAGAAAVGQRIHEQALAAGESDQVAGAWAKLYETVYGQLAQRFKRDALQLFEQRPLSIQRDDGVVFKPTPVGQRVVVDIPPSEATPGESREQRSIRRTAHLEALTSAYVRDARAQDPDIDPVHIRRELERRLEMQELALEAQQESGRGQQLLRAIAAYGGIRDDATEGEFRELASEGFDKRRRGPVMTKHGERTQTFGRKEWNGVPGVFVPAGGRGLTPDGMVEALMQDPQFQYLEGDLWNLLNEITVAMRAKRDVDVFPGTEELQELGIVPGTKWWDDSWQDPVDEDVDDSLAANPDDEELAQQELVQPRPLEESVGEVRALELLATEEALGVVIPSETRDPDTGEYMEDGPSFFAIDGEGGRSPVNCTSCAEVFLETSHRAGVIVGYHEEDNNGRIAEGMGHDFAIVDDRFLVDPWAHQVEGENPRAVFDLEDPQDLAFVRQQYADPKRWIVRQVDPFQEHAYSWNPYRNPRLGTDSQELEQAEPREDRRRSHRGPLEDAITRVRQQDVALGSAFFQEGMHVDSRMVPFQVAKDNRTILRAFAAAEAAGQNQQTAADRTVPLDQVFATQHTFRPDVVEEYLRYQDAGGQNPRPFAVQVEDRFYLGDGHHRAIAQWAKGQRELDLRVVESGLGLEALDEGAEAFTLTDEATLAAAQTHGLDRGRQADLPTTAEGKALEEERQRAFDEWLKANPRSPGQEFFQIEQELPDGFEVVAEHLTPREAARLRMDSAQRLLDVFETLPLDVDYEDAALAGVAKKGWYERSTKALRAVFGPVDSVRFAALLAAMSPKTTVEQNLLNALRLWVNWDEADRPTAPARIEKLLGRSVQAGGVLPAWTDNVVRALRAEDPLAIQLSGPKVDSFMHNLWGHMNAVTNDAWMATFALVSERVLAGRMQAIRDESGALAGGAKLRGANPGYLALSVKIRRVARSLTRKTGTTWTPAHVQETVWAWAKTLYELAEAEGSSAVRVLKEGGLTDAAIAQTPDFEQLFVMDAEVREILEAGGYGEVLETLERAVGRAARRRHAATGGVDQATARGITPALLRGARRLDIVRKERRAKLEAERNEGLKRATQKLAQARRAHRGRGGEFYQVEEDRFDPRKFATRTELVPTGKRELGTSRVNSPEDLATAMAAINVNAVERFDALVTNKRGIPIGIVGSFKGRVDQTIVHPDVLVSEAIRLEGAANIWFVHNHPSGNAQLSTADKTMIEILQRRFEDTGIAPRGIMAIGEAGSFAWYQPGVGQAAGRARGQSEADKPRKVSIVERQFASTGKLGDVINTPRKGVERIPELAGGEFGVVMMDTHNRPLAFVALDEQRSEHLRQSGELRELLKGISVSGATTAIVHAPGAGDVLALRAAQNVAAALERNDISVHDLIVYNPQGLPISVREHHGGAELDFGPEFHQVEYVPITAMQSRIIAAVQRSTLAKASGAQWKATIRNAGVNADEWAAIAVDLLEDTRVYPREELLAWLGRHQVRLDLLTLREAEVEESDVRLRAERVFDQMVAQEEERRLYRDPDSGPREVGLPTATFNEEEQKWEAFLELENGTLVDVGTWYDSEQEAMNAADAAANKATDANWGEWITDIRNSLDYEEAEREARAQLLKEAEVRAARFAEWTEPGADEFSYREVFISAPDTGDPFDVSQLVIERKALSQTQGSVTLRYRGEVLGQEGYADEMRLHPGGGWRGKPDAHWQAIAHELHRLSRGWVDGHSEYQWVRNPVVRLRFDARTDDNDVRTLFLEEVQPPVPEQQKRMPALFRKNWRELAMKWAIGFAVQHGYDRVAWTSGTTQVERYSLARHVDRLQWTGLEYIRDGAHEEYVGERAPGTGNAFIVTTHWKGDSSRPVLQLVVDQGGKVIEAFNGDRNWRGRELGDIIGEEVAARIVTGARTGAGELKDLDLAIGGRGLRKLYDEDLPNVVNRLQVVKAAKASVGTMQLQELRLVRSGGLWAIVNQEDEELYTLPGNDPVFEQRARAELEKRQARLTVPALELTDALREKVLGGIALFQEGGGPKQKGGFNPDTNVIRLISGKADLSTFLHESGHFFLELLGDIAATVKADTEDPAEQQLLADLATVLREGGYQGTLEEWRQLPVDARRGVHEAFARGFEQYLSDGKAPSPQLRDLFIRFRDWLVAVYKSARGLGVDVSPELRGVFDRLVASDEAIADARHEAQVLPLLTDPATAGVDPLTFEAYRAQVTEASRASREELDRLLLRDWRREREAWWKAERDVVRAAVATEVHQEPVYVAIAAMRHGTRPDGSPAYDKPVKLSKRAIVNTYGKDPLERLRGKQLYAVEGGIHPDTAAELFGFATGEALLEALGQARPMAQVIDAEADRRMREKHGDLLLDGMQLQEQAEAAVFEHRAKVISAELQALTVGMTGSVIPPANVIKAQADALIRRLPVRELRPGQYLQAARRASQSAFWNFGRNERRLAIRDKQQELVALAHWRAARDAKERADQLRDRLKQYADKQSTRKRIGKAGQEYLDQIDGFLERYEFARVSQKSIERRQSLRKFVKQLEADGLPVQIPEDVLDDSQRVNWQELPLEQLEGIAAAVEQIAHLARLKNKLLKAKDARELLEVRTAIADSIREHVARRPGTHEPRSADQQRKAFFEGMFASHRKIASLARELDGFKDGGPMWEYVIRPLNEAGNREASMHADATKRLAAIFERHYGEERLSLYKRSWIEALGARDNPLASLTKQGRLMVALNWGNETNRQRVLAGKNWQPKQVEAILDTLDRRDWQFVQDVWDFVDSYWPEIAAKQQRVVGLAPPKVEAVPVFTRFGEFRGGYFPLMYEGELSGAVFNLEEAAAADMQKAAAYVHSVPASGHTKERTEGNVTLPVRLDFGVIFQHTSRVIHDLTHHEALIDVGRVLGGDVVQSAIYDTLGPKAYDQFRRALKDIAVGDHPSLQEAEGALGYLSNGSTVVGLGWSFSTMLLQPFGLTQSMKRIGVRWVMRGASKWLRGAVHMDKVVAGIHEKSEFMRNRHRTSMREVNELRNRLGVDTGKFTAAADSFLRGVTFNKVTKQDMLDSYFYGIAKFQQLADVPTWLGAYEKALSADVDEDTAVQLADQAVLDSQGGGQLKDMAAVQRGGPAWKVWIKFYSFFNTTYNQWTESYRQAKRDGGVTSIGRLGVDYVLLFAAPAILGHVARSAFAGDLGDELEDPEQFAVTLAAELGAYMAGTMVGLRELGGALQGYAGYEGPAGARGFASVARLATQARQMELDEAFWRSLNTAGGVLFHYPAAQVERTVRGIKALLEGESENPLAPLAGPGKQ